MATHGSNRRRHESSLFLKAGEEWEREGRQQEKRERNRLRERRGEGKKGEKGG